MIVVDITLNLPEDVAREAEELGILASEKIEQWINDEIRRRKTQRLTQMLDQFAALDVSPLTNEELNEEIRAVRAERQARNARGH